MAMARQAEAASESFYSGRNPTKIGLIDRPHFVADNHSLPPREIIRRWQPSSERSY
jgi:hypothetical protein